VLPPLEFGCLERIVRRRFVLVAGNHQQRNPPHGTGASTPLHDLEILPIIVVVFISRTFYSYMSPVMVLSCSLFLPTFFSSAQLIDQNPARFCNWPFWPDFSSPVFQLRLRGISPSSRVALPSQPPIDTDSRGPPVCAPFCSFFFFSSAVLFHFPTFPLSKGL